MERCIIERAEIIRHPAGVILVGRSPDLTDLGRQEITEFVGAKVLVEAADGQLRTFPVSTVDRAHNLMDELSVAVQLTSEVSVDDLGKGPWRVSTTAVV